MHCFLQGYPHLNFNLSPQFIQEPENWFLWTNSHQIVCSIRGRISSSLVWIGFYAPCVDEGSNSCGTLCESAGACVMILHPVPGKQTPRGKQRHIWADQEPTPFSLRPIETTETQNQPETPAGCSCAGLSHGCITFWILGWVFPVSYWRV